MLKNNRIELNSSPWSPLPYIVSVPCYYPAWPISLKATPQDVVPIADIFMKGVPYGFHRFSRTICILKDCPRTIEIHLVVCVATRYTRAQDLPRRTGATTDKNVLTRFFLSPAFSLFLLMFPRPSLSSSYLEWTKDEGHARLPRRCPLRRACRDETSRVERSHAVGTPQDSAGW